MIKRLPDAEFEVMKAVWSTKAPMGVNEVARRMDKEWKIQTVISLMLRLTERGFIRTEKIGRERVYFPVITREEYLRFETGNFVKQYHESSFLNLVTTLYDGNGLTDADIDELLRWAKERREG
jgi:predicted transcriptional regulator